MAQTILTPISLWKDFDDSLDLQPEVLEERETDGIVFREISFSGRQTETGRVRVYGVEVRPTGMEKLPALLLLSEANRGVDLRLAERFARRGYCVFCMDYRGKTAETGRCTEYPSDVEYANFLRTDRGMFHADAGAKKTPWYEWTAAAIYAVRYLRSLPLVSVVGALGVREGGDIVWKLMAATDLACGICVNAAGWLAYRDVSKFGEEAVTDLDEEKRLFIAGIDSQSYAPFVRCPVLMLIATTDLYVDADKAYDTYVRVNKEQFATIDYSMGYGGAIDRKGVRNADMFMDKYLKDREIFLARPLNISFEEGEDEKLYAAVTSDGQGESVADAVYFAEDSRAAYRREWIRAIATQADAASGKKLFPLPVYCKTESIYAFARTEYSSGFTVSSRISFKKLEKCYKNNLLHSNILYDASMEGDCFVPAHAHGEALGECFPTDDGDAPHIAEGYGKIAGMTCPHGLKTYRIAQQRYAPQEKSMLHFCLYAEEDCYVDVSVSVFDAEGQHESYVSSLFCGGGGKWKNFVLPAHAFKNSLGAALTSFVGGRALQFTEEGGKSFIVTNILWI